MTLVAMILGLALAAPGAQAAPKSVDRFVGGANGSLGGQFFSPRGLGVHQATGDIYVADTNNNRIARYSSDGVFERAWGRDVVTGGTGGSTGFEICTVAADCKAGVTGALKGELNVPVGVAVDQTDGSVYVHDLGNRRVQRFDADGNFVLTFGKGVNQTNPASDICTQASGDVCKVGTTGSAAAQFGNNSTGSPAGRSFLALHPTTDDVFVGDPVNRRVMQYEPDGDFVRAWGFGVDTGAGVFEVCTIATSCASGLTSVGTAVGQFGSGAPIHLAVDASGVVYVSDSNLGNRIQRFDSDGFSDPPASLLAPIMATDQSPAGPLYNAPGVTTTSMAIDPDTGDLLVTRDPSSGETRIQQIATATATETEIHAVGSALTTIQGLAVDPNLDRIVASYAATPPGQGLFLLDLDGVTTPTMTPQAASGVEATSATINGTINPNGFAEYGFEYSADGVTWTQVPPTLIGLAGTSTVAAVPQTLTGLTPNTLYRFRMVSSSTVGGVGGCGSGGSCTPPQVTAVSAELTFLTDATPPTVTAHGATAVRDTTAVLQGTLNPNGSATTYFFEYGPTVGYGRRSPIPAASAGAGGADLLITQEVANLSPGATYHFRLCATNTVGTQCGGDRSFTTRQTSAPQGRAYEKVSPVSVAGVGVGAWYNGPTALAAGGTAAHEGERFAPMTSLGPMLVDGGMAWAQDIGLSERASGGWLTRPAMTLPAYGDPRYRMLGKTAATPDLGRFAVSSNGPLLRMFPEMESWGNTVDPTFVGDWQGRWELVGPTAEAQNESGDASAQMPVRFSDDGSLVLGMGSFRGLAGADDPVLDQVAGSGSYVVDYPTALANTFAGSLARTRSPLAACAGGTELPRVDDNGTVTGPPGSFSLTANYGAATTTLTVGVAIAGAPQVGHTVSGTGIPPGTTVVAVSPGAPSAGWTFEISQATTGAGAPAFLTGGQNSAALADDTLSADPCPAPAPGERQGLVIDASSGTFTVSFDGQVTPSLPYNVAPTGAGSLQAALENLSNLDPGDVAVTGAPAGGVGRYVVRFATDLGDVPPLSADATALGGGGTISVTDLGSTPRSATLISEYGAGLDGADAGSASNAGRNAISRDGSRAFFMSPDPSVATDAGVPASGCIAAAAAVCPPQLYVRQRNTDGSVSTRWISRAEDPLFGSQSPTLAGRTIFEGATPDGSAVFFRTNSPLTADDPNGTGSAPVTTGTPSANSWDLYMYRLPGGPDGDPTTPDGDPGGGDLVRISRGPSGSADPNGVNGLSLDHSMLRFAADDSDRVYFATSGALPGVGGSANGTITAPGGDPATTAAVNLYLYERGGSGESWTFVARLPRSTSSAIAMCASTGNTTANPIETGVPGTSMTVSADANCVRGNRDGSFVAFWTDGRLTADDGTDTGDIYAYDASADALARASRAQGGDAHPYACVTSGDQCNADSGIETNWMPMLSVVTDPASPAGRSVFFHSRSRLLPGDGDEGYDVYEWRNGDLTLITSGSSNTDGALYMGNSADGKNVYFATRDRYTWQDTDVVGDIYTARVGGGIPEPLPPPSCAVLVGACHGGGAGVSAPVRSETGFVPRDGNVVSGERTSLSLARLSVVQRRRAARTGTLALRIRASGAGKLTVTARARLGKRTRRVGRAAKRIATPGRTVVRVRLDRRARKVLRSGRVLRVGLQVAQAGARTRTATVALKRGKRS